VKLDKHAQKGHLIPENFFFWPVSSENSGRAPGLWFVQQGRWRMWVSLLDMLVRAFLKTGSAEITFADGTTRRYGDNSPPLRVAIHDESVPRRLVTNPELALGEVYVEGGLTIENDDLEGFLKILLMNRSSGNSVWWRKLADGFGNAFRFTHQLNLAKRSKSNVAHHYDLSAGLYDLFLDTDRQYSCAYFETGGETLEEAQRAKKDLIARKLLLKPGQRVLDIGCGWGGLAMTLARDHGVSVVGVTLSEEQHDLATKRVADAGLADRIDIRLTDYRAVSGRFDRIVSVGMFEHVGVPQFRAYFHKVRELLTDDGVALIHTIGRTSSPRFTSPWIRKYIFPGGYVPTISEVSKSIERERLWVADLEVWRLHYAETLRHWYRRFMANQDAAEQLYDERFCRMWRFYLLASEATFRHGWQAVFQFQLSREIGAVPLTRNYLNSMERGSPLDVAAQ
jgi:cyclopropane-fatty-acyl-phospholipid synthase